jgi:hypothetical protein
MANTKPGVSFTKPHNQKSKGVKSGDLEGHDQPIFQPRILFIKLTCQNVANRRYAHENFVVSCTN